MSVPKPDTPASIDELGFDRFAEPLAKTIAETDHSTTPWTIGVYGEWGSGKSTFLRLVENKLAASGVRPIWFNAWKYARDDNLWAALIETIVVDARRSVRWYRAPDVRLRIWLRSIDFGAGFFELFRKLLAIGFKVAALTVLIVMALSLLPVPGNPMSGWLAGSSVLGSTWARVLVGVVAAFATRPEALLKLFDVKLGADLGAFRRRRSHRSQTALLDDFAAEFQGVLKVVYSKKPLVVIIDDLDRCLPEQTLQIIETIKLVLDEPGCVFLLAVDREVIEHAIRVKYKDLPSAGELGETFFEKIVQLPYSLPPPAEAKVEPYIRSISADPDVLACLPILRGAPPYNPRRIKRTVQAFTLLKDLSADLRPVPAVLAKLVVIQSQFRQVYRAAINDHSLLARLEQAYRQPELKVDDLVSAQVERFSELYPGLRTLFRLQLNEQDAFRGVAIESYLSIVDTVAAPDEPRQRTIMVSCAPGDLSLGERLARALRDVGARALVGKVGESSALPFDYLVGIASRESAALHADIQWGDAVARGIPFLAVKVEDVRLSLKNVLDVSGLRGVDIERAVLAELGYVTNADEEFERTAYTNLPEVRGDLVRREELYDQVVEPLTVLVGMPGSGKTTFAVRYALDNFADYDVVWLIRSDSQDEDITALEHHMGMRLHEIEGRYLLIYDDFADLADTRRPVTGAGQVIVTTRNGMWDGDQPVVEVGPLSRSESVDFLGVPDADLLADVLGDLPLALARAKDHLDSTGTSVQDYLPLLDEHGIADVRSVLTRATDRLSQGAVELLRLLPCFDRPPLPMGLWADETDIAHLDELRQLSLVKVVDDVLDVHPLVLRFAAEVPSTEESLRAVLGRVGFEGSRAELARLGPHLQELISHARSVAPIEAAQLLLDLGRHWVEAGAWREALSCADQAADLDPLHPYVSRLRELSKGRTVLMLGGDESARTTLASQLQDAFGKALFAVVEADDPVACLIASPQRVDCVVAVVAGGDDPELNGQLALSRLVGAGVAIASVGFASVPQGLREHAKFEVRVDSGNDVYELADRLPGLAEPPNLSATECTQFRAVLIAPVGAIPQAVMIEFGAQRPHAVVLTVLPGMPAETAIVLFETDEPVSIMVGTRFDSSLGRGVVTRIVK
ncbi:P-loop NTPase fold protein [Lentzea sp. NPDC003310]|uniref:P-loop NTPase fold protein n=1 Tax=Lentzea sp. NPDC003310 TaxID=3154447 RepID=UPI0033B2928C